MAHCHALAGPLAALRPAGSPRCRPPIRPASAVAAVALALLAGIALPDAPALAQQATPTQPRPATTPTTPPRPATTPATPARPAATPPASGANRPAAATPATGTPPRPAATSPSGTAPRPAAGGTAPAAGGTRPAAPAAAPAAAAAAPRPATPPGTGGPGGPQHVVQHGSWAVYVGPPGPRRVCFAIAQPQSSTTQPPNRPRDPIFFFITSRPADNVRNETSIAMGYTLRDNTDAMLEIGNQRIPFYSKDGGAWIKNTADEARLITLMRASPTMTITGESGRGTKTSDRYSLNGLPQALDRVAQECR